MELGVEGNEFPNARYGRIARATLSQARPESYYYSRVDCIGSGDIRSLVVARINTVIRVILCDRAGCSELEGSHVYAVGDCRHLNQ